MSNVACVLSAVLFDPVERLPKRVSELDSSREIVVHSVGANVWSAAGMQGRNRGTNKKVCASVFGFRLEKTSPEP